MKTINYSPEEIEKRQSEQTDMKKAFLIFGSMLSMVGVALGFIGL